MKRSLTDETCETSLSSNRDAGSQKSSNGGFARESARDATSSGSQISHEPAMNFASLLAQRATLTGSEKGLPQRESRIMHEAGKVVSLPNGSRFAARGCLPSAVYPRAKGRGRDGRRLDIPRGQYVRTISQKVGQAGCREGGAGGARQRREAPLPVMELRGEVKIVISRR